MEASGRKYRIIKTAVSLATAFIVFLMSCKGTLINNLLLKLDNPFCDLLYQSERVGFLPISIIGIDDKTMDALGQQSEWSRQVYADLVNRLCPDEEHAPSVIAFDIMFTGNKSDASTGEIDEGDIAFAEAAEKAGNVVAGSYIEYDKKIEGNHDSALLNLKHISNVVYPYDELNSVVSCGFVNEQTEADNYVRTVMTVENYEDNWMDCFALSVLKKFVNHYNRDEEFHLNNPGYSQVNLEDYKKYDITKYRFSYSGRPNSQGIYSYYSLIDILDGTVTPTVKNEIVLVGAYAPGLQDSFKVPISSRDSTYSNMMYGVEIHANIIQALAEGNLQTDPSETSAVIISIVFSLIAGIFCYLMFGLRLRKGAVAGALLFAAILVAGKLAYSNGYYIFILVPMLCLLLIYIGFIIFFYSRAKLEKGKINKAFRMYVAPEIVDEMAADGNFKLQLGGKNKDIAVLFVDIRGFTTMSESLKPEEVVEVLNDYFAIVTDAIFKNKGTLDKFIGDAAMAVFNSPFDLDDYVYRAVRTALDIAAGSDTIREKFLERFGKTVNYGIGVNCGEATIGNIGSPFRMDYTAIGDTVNTAARLESNAPAGSILISGEVKRRLGDRIKTEAVGEIPLKGKKVGIMVYRVLELY